MNIPKPPHRWNLTPTAAIALQDRLSSRIRKAPISGPVRLIAGGDATYSADGESIIAGWVVWDLKSGSVVETVIARRPVRFPYLAGLLSFREAPALIAAARRLTVEPDVFMLDGHGVAHPRRFGIASHVGLLLDRPTFGCAKTRLSGAHDTPAETVGATKPLIDGDELIGRVVRTQKGVNPVFVSVGHRITLDEAVRWTLRGCTDYRLPEPVRRADQLVGRELHG